MHLDAPFLRVPPRLVTKSLQIKISAQLSVDAPENIQIERRGHSSRIVVRQDLGLDVLLQVCPQQQRVSRQQSLAQLAQKHIPRVAIEISDRASQKQNQQMVLFSAPFRHRAQSFQVWLL